MEFLPSFKVDVESEVEEEEEEEQPVEDNIPALLKRIAQEPWFPKGVTLDVENVTLALCKYFMSVIKGGHGGVKVEYSGLYFS